MPAPIALERRPYSGDVHDDDEVHAYLAKMVAEQVATQLHPVPAIHLLCEDHEEVLEWVRVLRADPDADLAATWQAVCHRTDVERRVLVLQFERGEAPNEAVVFEQLWEDGEPVGWWFGRRGIEVREGIGGLVGNAWNQHAGEGPPPEPFASMLAVAPGARAAQLLPARPIEPEVWMQTGTFPNEAILPNNASEMCAQTHAVVLGALESEGFRYTMVFLTRGRSWERWLLGEALPTAPDDMVRWICERGPQPDCIATAEAALATVDNERKRVIRIVAEMGGERSERAIILLPKPENARDVVAGPSMARDLGPVPEDEGWIGVKPMIAGEPISKVLGYGRPK